MKLAAALLAVLPALQGSAGSADGGERIFREGVSPRGTPLVATVGAGDAVPAALLPCVNCHGPDGRGRREGGVRPADISPAALLRPLRDERRQRPAYDAARLRRAITMGLDAGGQPLDAAMPRYALSLADADDLLAYLARLDQRHEAGVAPDRLRIGVRGAALVAPTQEIYGRRIELVSLSGPPARSDDLLLLIDAGADGSDSLVAAAEEDLPAIVFAADTTDPGRSGFVITAAPATQQRALDELAASVPAPQVVRDCSEAAVSTTARTLLLTGRVAAACDLTRMAWPAGQSLRVVLPAPPEATLRQAVAEQVLQLVAELLRQAGREVSRAALVARLQTVREPSLPPLPPLHWSPTRHHGLDHVWVLRLDDREGRLQRAPGWMAVPEAK
ncbi:c-type cytochrome [Tahibacter caeni]|uniref:c-type cytochrome n=1 Tax=Tahibacter caeni TaxID=1453545 RepID=UPI0021478A8E|nr:c-type cytochrome [Tahibacter caeni]